MRERRNPRRRRSRRRSDRQAKAGLEMGVSESGIAEASGDRMPGEVLETSQSSIRTMCYGYLREMFT